MTMRQTSFRLSDREFEVLDEIKQRMGLPDRASAMRYALRWFKRGDQLDLKPTRVTNWDSSDTVLQRLACGCGDDLSVTARDMKLMSVACRSCGTRYDLVRESISDPVELKILNLP